MDLKKGKNSDIWNTIFYFFIVYILMWCQLSDIQVEDSQWLHGLYFSETSYVRNEQ